MGKNRIILDLIRVDLRLLICGSIGYLFTQKWLTTIIYHTLFDVNLIVKVFKNSLLRCEYFSIKNNLQIMPYLKNV